MEPDTLQFVQLLRFPDAEIWQAKDDRATLFAQGALEVFYNKQVDLMFLRVNNFKYGLDRSIKIFGSFDDSKNMRSYILPDVNGFFLLRGKAPSNLPGSVNLENIFEKYGKLYRGLDLEGQLKSYDQTSGLLSKGQELAREAAIKGGDLLSKGTGVFTGQGAKDKLNPNHTVIRQVEEMMLVDESQTNFENFSLSEAIKIKEQANEISKRQTGEFWDNLTIEKNEVTVEFQKAASLQESTQTAGGDKSIGIVETQEESMPLKREDEMADISEMPEVTGAKEPSLISKAKDKVDQMAQEVSAQAGELKDKVVSTASDLQGQATEGWNQASSQVSQKVGDLKEQASQKASDIQGQAKETWSQLSSEASQKAEDAKQKGQELQGQAKESLNQASSQASQKAGELKDQASQKTSDLQGQAKETWSQLSSEASQKAEDVKQKGQDLQGQAQESLNKASSQASSKAGELKEKASEKVDEVQGKKEEVQGQAQEKWEEITSKLAGVPEVAEAKQSEVQGQATDKWNELSSKVSGKAEDLKERVTPSEEQIRNIESHEEYTVSHIEEELRHEQQAKGESKSKKGGESQGGSQPSTMQSLGHEGQEGQPTGPQSTEIIRSVWHKAADTIAEGVDTLRGLVAPSAEELAEKTSQKLDQAEQKIKSGELQEQVKDLSNKASEKVSQVKEQVSSMGGHSNLKEAGEELSGKVQEQVKDLSNKTGEKVSQVKEQISSKVGHSNLKEAGEELSGEVQHQIEKVNEEVRHVPHMEERVIESQGQGHGGQEAHHHEHHHLSTESPSFQPTEQTHKLVEKVKEGLEEDISLTKIVEETSGDSTQPREKDLSREETTKKSAHQEEQSSKSQGKESTDESQEEGSQERPESQSTEERVPLLDKVIGGFQSVSEKITSVSEKISSVTNKLKPAGAGTEGHHESHPSESHESHSSEHEHDEQGKSITERIHDISERLSTNAANVKSTFSRPGKEGESAGHEEQPSKSEEHGQSIREKISSTAHNLSEKVSSVLHSTTDKVSGSLHGVSDKISGIVSRSSGKEGSAQEQGTIGVGGVMTSDLPTQPSSNEHPPGTEFGQPSNPIANPPKTVGAKVQDVAGKISEKVEGVKGNVSGALHSASSQISGGVQGIKGKFTSAKGEAETTNEWEEAERLKQQESEQPQEETSQKQGLGERISQKMTGIKESVLPAGEGQSLKERVQGGLGNLSDKISGNKDEGFHKVETGFTETVTEYKHEHHVGELSQNLVSDNPFEPLTSEQADKSNLSHTQKLKEGLSDTGSKISQKIVDAKDKVQSQFAAEDKENAPKIA